jgi:hypothetical protein
VTAVYICGMHRSGTSMVARLLNLCGVHLGLQSDMMPPLPDNPEGYWEHVKLVALNNDLLAQLGGGWDYPPPIPSSWCEDDDLVRLRRQADVILDELRGYELWGWKDPRSSLLADFWLTIQPDLKFVICLRHPLEVAESLRIRNMFSRAMSLALWREYNERLLKSTTPDQRIITHYDAYFSDLPAELSRVLGFLSAHAQPDTLQRCATAVRRDLRHNRAHAYQLLDPGIPLEVFELYRRMCEEANWQESGSDGVLEDMHAVSPAVAGPELDHLRAHVQSLTNQVAELTQALDDLLDEASQGKAQLASLARELELLQTSRSWRLTAPLRELSTGLTRVLGRAP